MVKKKSLVITVIFLMILLLASGGNVVLGKTNHFKAFATLEVHYDTTYPSQIARRMVNIMEALEYVNYTGSGLYSVTNSKSDIMSYINMSGKNYGFALVSHADSDGILRVNDDESIEPSEISGNWHLVLTTGCSSFQNDDYARAFKTVGYAHRASIGFTDTAYFVPTDNFWAAVESVVCSTSLGNVVNYAIQQSGAPAVLYGDSSWNGYAWN